MHTKRKVNGAPKGRPSREFWGHAPGNAVIRGSESRFPSRRFVHKNMKNRLVFGNLCSLNVGQLIAGFIGKCRDCQTSL